MEHTVESIDREFTIECTVDQDTGTITAKADYPAANQFTTYGCYLIDKQTKEILQRKKFQSDPVFQFHAEPGLYYARVFIRTKADETEEPVKFASSSKSVRVYAVVPVKYEELEQLDLYRPGMTLYKIDWDGVTFDFAVNYIENASSAVVFGTGAVNPADPIPLPLFSRINWAPELSHCAIYYFDPALYSRKLHLFWCYGTNGRWYLENIAVIIWKLLQKLHISHQNTLFYGSSGGGYLSVLLATMLHGRAAVVNPQFLLERFHPIWFDPEYFSKFKAAVLEPGEELIRERISAAALIRREGFFPPLQVWQNDSAKDDMENQIIPFLQELVDLSLSYGERLSIAFFSREGGHNSGPSKADCIASMDKMLSRSFPCLDELGALPPGSLLARLEQGEFGSLYGLGDNEYLRDKFLEMYCRHPIPAPQKYFTAKEECIVADQLLNGMLKVCRPLEALPYSLETLDWNVTFSSQPGTFLLYLQGLTPVITLVGAYIQTKYLPYIEQARKFVEFWAAYEKDKYKSASNPLCWYDHPASLRTEALIYLGRVAAADNLWDNDFYSLLFQLLKIHGAWLNQDNGYRKHHNHGVMQDQALIYVGAFFQNREWISHGIDRFSKQAEWAFNCEGVHRENSSGYAVLVNRFFKNICKLLLDLGEISIQSTLDTVQRSEEYIEWCVMPNSYLVQLGDTQLSCQKNVPSVSSSVSKFYPNAGMYFYRSKTEASPESSTWKVAKSGYSVLTHKHADDCSFVLYAKGHEIFSDGGVYGYNKDAFRAYFISAKAHNTVIVDNTSYIPSKKMMHAVGMDAYQSYENYDYVRLFNNAYTGVAFQRNFYSADDLTLILDTLDSNQEHTYSQLFHLSEDMSILSANNYEVVLRLADSGYIVRLRQHGSPVNLQVIHGNKEIPGYGLLSRSTKQIDVTTTLKFDLLGSNSVFATSITIEDRDGFVRLGERKEKADALRYDAQCQAFTLGTLTVPYRQDFSQN